MIRRAVSSGGPWLDLEGRRLKRTQPTIFPACAILEFARSLSVSSRSAGEHVSMANRLLGVFLFLILCACSTPPTALTTDAPGASAGEIERFNTIFVDSWTTPTGEK